ncbi:transcription factor YY2 [Culex quinquefasciatus]|uniref:transcription factor YY2 n=1 Tax=Culex quinquefasciatus TaxID=7176 RepID=UPI0018E3068F|nr:transcription factor YY2 [Culex quinquefasciatus]
MEYGVDRTFDSHHQVDEYYSSSNDQFVLPPFSMERAQDFGLYYEQESPLVVETVSDYVPEQQTIYYTGSTGSYPAYSPQQSERTYTEGPTADSELDQLLQQPYEYQSGAYTMDADMISMFQSQEQKVELASIYTDNPFGKVFPKDEVLDDLLEEAIKNEDFNVPLPELSTPESILEDIRNTAILSQGAILEQYGAAVVSPLDSGCSTASSSEYSDIPVTVPQGEHSPTSFQELFDSVALDEASSMEIQETQAVIMYIDEHGTLRPYEPTVTVAPTASKPVRKRGRKPLPKAPVTESEFYCLPCNKVFKRHRGLLQHNHYHHSGPKEHQCAQCGKKYPTLERLQSHIQKHNDAFKPYGCQHCTKRFSHPHDMKRHIWTSHGEAPFSCSFCDKRFGRLDHVEQHEISHKNNTVIVKK